MSWDILRETYIRQGLVLALGGGISTGSGLPDWGGLMERLVTGHMGPGAGDLYNDLQGYGFSLPAIGSLVEAALADRTAFIEQVRAALYHDFPFYPGGVPDDQWPAFAEHIQVDNPTLQAVAALCAARRGDEYKANPLLHAIVTFNLDALLETYVFARYGRRLLKTIERPSETRVPGAINCYHMHGYLRFDRMAGDPSQEAPDQAVLTEHDYFDFFNESTSLFNYTFLYLLREFHCLFIGLSMQDDNIRRLLHYSKKERDGSLRHVGADNGDASSLRHFALLKRTATARLDEAVEASLRSLGTLTVWVDDFGDIPDRLREVYEAPGCAWGDVFG